jgi:hypothetical protein
MLTRIHQQGEWKVEVKYFEAVFGKSEVKCYEIEEANPSRGRKWRAKFNATVMPIFEQVSSLQNIEFEKAEDLLKLMPIVQKILLESFDDVFDLLILYSPEVEADQEWIMENGTDRQILAAFMGVLQLAVPFEINGLLERVSGLKNKTTGQNLPSASGDTPQA